MANFSYRFSIYNINGQTPFEKRFSPPPPAVSWSSLFSRVNVSTSAEALNQGENVDLDALMADLCSIEQELGTVNAKPNSAGGMARLGLTDAKVRTPTRPCMTAWWSDGSNRGPSLRLQVRQKPPAGRSSRQLPAAGAGGGGGGAGGGSNSVGGGGGSSGASSGSSSARASPAGTIRVPAEHHGRAALASNFSLDDITAQLEKVRGFVSSMRFCDHFILFL